MKPAGTNTAQATLVKKYGFNAERRRERLAVMGLTAVDHAAVHVIHQQVIQPNVAQLIDQFYTFLMALPRMRRILNQAHIPSLKQAQAEYLLSFGREFDSAAYFEYRLRIGLAHERVGLTLDLYLGAYRELAALIIAAIPQVYRQDFDQYKTLVELIQKIAMLDMSLATDTYYAASVAELADSIKDLEEAHHELTVEIQIDPLTQVYSRRYLFERLEQQIHSQQRHGDDAFCVALVDLDHFKHVNDNYGHPIGDCVLQQVARAMQHCTRSGDLVGRYGGEEFLIIFSGTDLATSHRVADRIVRYIARQPMVCDTISLSVTVSIGLAKYQVSDSLESLIKRADDALYSAKRDGRNRVVLGDTM